MWDHSVLLVDGLLTESTLEAAIESEKQLAASHASKQRLYEFFPNYQFQYQNFTHNLISLQFSFA